MGNLLLASLANSWQKLLAGNLINNWIFFFILFVIGVILLRFSLFEGPRVFFGTFGILGTLAIFLASFFMPLPFVEQLRLELPRWFSLFFGIIFLVAGLIVILLSIISLKIKVATSLEKLSKIVSGGIYSFLRHPLYSGLLLAYLGWALIFNSILTLLCFPIAFLLLLILSFLEEKDLLRIYGPLYREYQKKIRWRFLPYII
ncbi:isoprenylcysteine carboxylmethyltransferase family protein [Candidatus Parcubacteria bacterium]|nr:isoprenylcysteine carboxylmethyltransferase family protein [Candidatus Parcubacteria bacterium]